MPRSLAAALLVVALLVAACTGGGRDDAAAPGGNGRGAGAGNDATPSSAGRPGGAVDGDPAEVTPLTWQACGEGFECATLVVPWTYDGEHAGRTMELPVIRRTASGPGARIGSLVINPGGPGSSGVRFLRASASALGELGRRFDLVSFDPRGVGKAVPAVRCRPEGLDDRVEVLGPGGLSEDLYRARLESVRQRCLTDQGDLLAVVGTNNAARDLDVLRRALGEAQLTYLGFSYGTRLGTAYAALVAGNDLGGGPAEPTWYRAMALDGAEAPLTDHRQAITEQYLGFEAAFAAFDRWCRTGEVDTAEVDTAEVDTVESPRGNGGGHDGGDDRAAVGEESAAGAAGDAPPECLLHPAGGARPAVRAIEQRLADEGPLRTRVDGRRLTLAEFYFAVAAGLYRQEGWPALAAALHDGGNAADGTALHHLVDRLFDRREDGTYGNAVDANQAVSCVDTPLRPSFEEALSWGRDLRRELGAATRAAEPAGADAAPVFGALAEVAFMDCVAWDVPADPVAFPDDGVHVPALVVGTRADPATPHRWAAELAATLVSSALLTYEGYGHTAYFSSRCVRERVDRYLLEARLPVSTTCPRDRS